MSCRIASGQRDDLPTNVETYPSWIVAGVRERRVEEAQQPFHPSDVRLSCSREPHSQIEERGPTGKTVITVSTVAGKGVILDRTATTTCRGV